MKKNENNIILFKTNDEKISVDVRFCEETVWLTLDQMAVLFERDKSTISRHIKNIFDEMELRRDSVVANFATTATDGKTYQVDYYDLDVIISVGYRVKSLRGTQFRQWATKRLNEYIRKGFTLDDERTIRTYSANGAETKMIRYYYHTLLPCLCMYRRYAFGLINTHFSTYKKYLQVQKEGDNNGEN
jgi:hypothetical protein